MKTSLVLAISSLITLAALVGSALQSSAEEKKKAIDLFAKNGSGMQMNEKWEMKDGVLGISDTPGGSIWSKDSFQDFRVMVEYKTSTDCNSGLFFRSDPKNPVQGGFEIQIASPGKYDGKHVVGSLYDAQKPSEAAGKPDGEWNTMIVTCKGPQIKVVLNGKTVIEANLDDWKTAQLNPDGSKNKFKTPLKDLPRSGHIGLQYHGQPVWFRNLKVQPL